MMPVNRRTFFKGLGLTAIAAAGVEPEARAALKDGPSPNAAGMLYDATLCIGCKACVVACKAANDGKPELDALGIHDAPRDLSASTKTVIKLYREGDETSFYKAQCMHCVDPACVSACMFGALHKGDFDVVAYDVDRCIGCRYCQVACPFNVPKFEWDTPTPKIVKCEMCRHRLAEGGIPACVEVCPRQAITFGTRVALLAKAKRRIAEAPDRYYPKVYGETDGGGTQVLFLSPVPFEKLGLPTLGDEPVPALSETVQHTLYQGFTVPLGLYALLGGVLYRNRRSAAVQSEEEKP